ncbi:HAMP domain-containing histidine kinase [Flavisolibacter sp. BT320]|nr:HAMP domain-containing histidine kinase [Flavisolibacter longurius]
MKTFRIHNRHFRLRYFFLSAVALLLLSFLTAWFFNSSISVAHQKQSLQQFIAKQQQDANALMSDLVLMRKLVRKEATKEEFETLTAKRYGFFIFQETLSETDAPVFWNTQRVTPPPPQYDSSSLVTFQKYFNGYYVVHRQRLDLPGMSNTMVAYAMIPVLTRYPFESNDSRTNFAHDRNAIEKIAIAEGRTEFPIVSFDKKVLFYLKEAHEQDEAKPDMVTIVLRLTVFLFLLIAFHFLAVYVLKKKGNLTGIVFLALGLLVLRFTLYYFPGLLSLRSFSLFDPSVYGSNFLNRSLGDLLINAVMICWLMLFAWNYLGPLKKLPYFLNGKKVVIAGVVGVFVLLFITFQLATIVHNLVMNSKISFDVTDFSSITVYTGFSFLILALLSLSYYYFTRLLFRAVLMAIPNLVHLYFVVALMGLVFLTFQSNQDDYSSVLFRLPILAWLVGYTLILTQEQAIINRFRVTIAGILFWAFMFSVSLAALIMSSNREREQRLLKGMAEKYEELWEPTKEKTLRIILQYLDNRYLNTNFHRFYNYQDSYDIRDSIATSQITSSFSKYSMNIYLFDSAGTGINNPDSRSYAELENIYTVQSKPAGAGDLMYYETSLSDFVYIVKREIFDSTKLKGILFLLARPRNFSGRTELLPEQFRRGKFEERYTPSILAIYKNNKLIQQWGTYPFLVSLAPQNIPAAQEALIEKDEYNELWYKGSNKKIIVVVSKKESLIESITLFSYLFCSFLFMIGIIRLFELSAQIIRSWPEINIFSSLSIRSQIHATIIFISILSFLIIGVATISYFVQRNDRNANANLNKTATSTHSEYQKLIKDLDLNFTSVNFPTLAGNESLHLGVDEISTVHGQTVNVYDIDGNLQITSAKDIYTPGVLSTKMNPQAYFHLRNLNQAQLVQIERLPDLEYRSLYMAIRNANNDTYAYLNVPSFTSADELNQEISNFLVTIINLNAFILLIAGVVALFITNRITRSFSIIGNKMKEVTLGKTNQEIEWSKDDEIGELVTQYNKMVHQLEESASALAKSEREGAWREMARQVAHEIKNPLTPMKLSIQYLQKAIQNNQPNVQELTTNVASTLIEQIDHLSKIAADFSQFANIGNKRLERIDLHNVIGSLLDLFSTNPKVDVSWKPVSHEVLMQVDKTHMNRLFTNLLTNAVDACSERQQCIVTITEKIVGNDFQVAVADNGDGIPMEMQSKIFTPNFTTKTSGTGLGLAMCKGIVEQAGGRIWFTTEEGVGTTFFVQLPLAAS